VAAFLVTSGVAPVAAEADLRIRIDVFMSLARAFSSYSPRPLDVRVALFSTTAGAPEQRAVWRELVGGELVTYRVPGDHYTLLRSPHVERVAKAIRSSVAALDHG